MLSNLDDHPSTVAAALTMSLSDLVAASIGRQVKEDTRRGTIIPEIYSCIWLYTLKYGSITRCGVSNIYVEDGKTKKAQNRHEETEKRKQR